MSNLDTIVIENNTQNNEYSVKNTQYETRKAVRTLPMNRVMTKNNIETFIGESNKYTQIPKKRKKKHAESVQRASMVETIPTPSDYVELDFSENVPKQVENDLPLMQPASVVTNKINTNLCLRLYTFFIIFGVLCLIGFFGYRLYRKRNQKDDKHQNNENNKHENVQVMEGGKNKQVIRKRDARGRFIKSK